MSRTPRKAAAGDVVAGRRPVVELLRAGRRRVHRIGVQVGTRPPDELVVLATRAGVPIDAMSPAEVRAFAGFDAHQGVVAFADSIPLADLTGLLPTARFLVALDEVADPRNLGAIVRVAEAAGADGLILMHRRSAPLSPTMQKAAAGAAEWLPIVPVINLFAALEAAKKAGMWVVGLEPLGRPPEDVDLFDERIVVVVGSEGGGLRPRIRVACDAFVGIPMRGKVDSLNVSAAVAVVAFAVANRHNRQNGRGFAR